MSSEHFERQVPPLLVLLLVSLEPQIFHLPSQLVEERHFNEYLVLLVQPL